MTWSGIKNQAAYKATNLFINISFLFFIDVLIIVCIH